MEYKIKVSFSFIYELNFDEEYFMDMIYKIIPF